MASYAFDLNPVPPFRLDLTVWALRRRVDNVVDRWDGRTYRRVLIGDAGEPFEVAVSQDGPSDAPHLNVRIQAEASGPGLESEATLALKSLLGIDLELDEFYALAHADGNLKPLAAQFRGFKPPRFATYFEALVNGISCQQLSLTVGIRLLRNLTECFGVELGTEEGAFHAFPRPQDLVDVDIERLRKMGFSYGKAGYITELAQSITKGQLILRELEALNDREAVDRLRGLKGVGRWTAEYFLLRGLGRTHIFPADDVGARNNLQHWLGLPATVTYEQVHEALQPWEGFGGLIYFHLLLKSLNEKGALVE